jgi:hypothetical protein
MINESNDHSFNGNIYFMKNIVKIVINILINDIGMFFIFEKISSTSNMNIIFEIEHQLYLYYHYD